MEKTLTFKFDNETEFDDRAVVYLNAEHWRRVVKELDDWLRVELKHNPKKYDPCEMNLLKLFRERLHDEMNEEEVTL